MKEEENNIADRDLQSLHARWKKMGNASAGPSPDAARRAAARLTEPARLQRAYLRLAVMGLCFPLLSMAFRSIEGAEWIIPVYSLYGLVMAAILFYFAHRVRGIRYVHLPVMEAVESISRLHRLHRTVRAISMTCAMVIVAFILYYLWLSGDSALFWGGVSGGIVGLIIGLRVRRRMNQRYRAWRASFRPE